MGLALLAGHANSNTDSRPQDPAPSDNADNSALLSAEDALNLQDKKIKYRAGRAGWVRVTSYYAIWNALWYALYRVHLLQYVMHNA